MLSKYVITFLFSFFDAASIFVLIMGVFRINIKNNYKKVLLSLFFYNVFATIISSVVHNYSLIILMPVVALIFYFVFRENSVYAFWISTTGYVTFLLVQIFLAALLQKYNLMTADDMNPYSAMGHYIQVATFVISATISMFLNKVGEGFVFDFDNPFKQKKNLKSSKIYTVISLIATLLIAYFYPFIYNNSLNTLFYLTIVLTLMCFVTLIIFSFKRNKEETISVFN